MKYELIITEKPQAAKKIAEALAEGKPIKKANSGVPYYDITRGKKDILVGCAVGHLFSVDEKKKGPWAYPVFDIEWKPASESKKGANFSKKYATTLKKLAKEADTFTVATDYDIEGEVIGLNVVRYLCKQKDASRMKFSTLTKPDIIKAYENKSAHINWGQANAGETRHFLDWMYGINLSRALTLSVKHATGMHKVLSSGRVQGPALKIIVEKEKEIKAFKPEPYWQIQLLGKIVKADIEAWHKEDKIFEKKRAETIMKNVSGAKKGKVSDVSKNEINQQAPFPFDLTTLQTEAYRTLKISPKHTLEIAQTLYTDGYISYPRTSSQKLPKEIEYDKIIKDLTHGPFKKEADMILAKKELKPNEGKKSDPAHPSIYPTGIIPKLAGKEAQLYELIVRRFLATFGDPAVRETMKITIDVNNEIFIAKGTRTKVKGWHEIYGRFATFKEEELPAVKKDDVVDIKEINNLEKETLPPKRYTPASIIKELEKRGLGTKATRASIVDNLFQRGYVDGVSIEATDLGMRTVEILEKYAPEILDEELTRNFEIEMEQIRESKKTEEEVLEEAKKILTKLLEDFKKKEQQIGKELSVATIETQKEKSKIGPCPQCDGNIVIKKGKFGEFAACDNYPECKATFSLPKGVMVKTTDKICETCKHPMLIIIRRAKRPQEICLNPDCPSKKISEEEKDKEGDQCPTCMEGKLVVRKGIYGSFIACSNYPKCKHTEKTSKKEGEETEKKATEEEKAEDFE